MMIDNNKAEYIPTKFIMDLSEIDWDENDQITDETFPMFVHEYCHYIQDVSTISAILGFYYKMIDVAELTKITCYGTGKIINIPIQKDIEGHSINKNKKLYSYYCGHVISFNDQFNFDIRTKEVAKISLGKNDINIPLYKLDSPGHPDILVGTYALQESQAYYCQKLIETEILKENKNICFKISADSLPNYPYRFVDYLFDSFQLNTSIETKAFIVDLCLNSCLPLVTLIKVLELLKEKGMTLDIIELNNIYLKALILSDIPQALAIHDTIASFFKNIILDVNRDYFKKGINWYLETIAIMREHRTRSLYRINGIFSNINHVKGFMIQNRPPAILKNNDIAYFNYANDKLLEGQNILDAVTILFLYVHIYSLSTASNIEELFFSPEN